MLATIKTMALSLALGLGALTAVPASAATLQFGVDTSDGSMVDVQYRHYPRDRDFRDRDFRRCSPERAAFKARRMGLRNARVVDVSRRTITVRGRAYGDRARVVFGRAASCPVIDRF